MLNCDRTAANAEKADQHLGESAAERRERQDVGALCGPGGRDDARLDDAECTDERPEERGGDGRLDQAADEALDDGVELEPRGDRRDEERDTEQEERRTQLRQEVVVPGPRRAPHDCLQRQRQQALHGGPRQGR